MRVPGASTDPAPEGPPGASAEASVGAMAGAAPAGASAGATAGAAGATAGAPAGASAGAATAGAPAEASVGAQAGAAVEASAGAVVTASAGATALAWIFAIALAIRGILAWRVPSPYIFPDELVYTELARSLIESGRAAMRGQALNFPTLLYPLLIAPFEALPDARMAFRAIQAFNAVLVTSAIVPVYLLARIFVARPLALGVAALSQLLPGTLYATLAMTENVFFPVLMWAAYFAVKAASAEGARWKVGLGVALALGFFAKPHGMVALPLVLVALVGQVAWSKRTERSLARTVADFWPTCAILGAAIGVQMVRALVVGGGHLDASSFFGSYASGLEGSHPFNAFWFGFAALGTLLAVGISVGFLPLVLFGQFCEEGLGQKRAADGALAVFTLALGALLLAITANHTVTLDDGLRLHERYCFHLAPLLLVGAAAVSTRSKPSWDQVGLSAIFAACAAAYLLTALRSPVTVDSLSYAAFFRPAETFGARPTAWVAGLVMATLVGLGALLWHRNRPVLAASVLAVFMGGVFGLAFASVHWTSTTWGTRDRYATFLASHTAAFPYRPIAFIRHDGRFWDYQMAEFHLRNQTRTYQLIDRPTGFNEEEAGLQPDGELTALRTLPGGSFVVAGEDLPLALSVVARFDGVVLYVKDGAAVRLSDKKQIADLAGKLPRTRAGAGASVPQAGGKESPGKAGERSKAREASAQKAAGQ